MIRSADGLTTQQQQFMEFRYVEVLREFRSRCQFYAALFHSFRTVITVGSLLVPALLSVQYSNKTAGQNSYEIEIYWITWVVSLLVTMSNGVQALLKVDKKYFYLHTTYEQLISEGWQFLQLTGRYAGQLNNTRPTYRNQFILFAHFIEKIKMRQVEEEYYKALESHHVGSQPAAAAAAQGRQDDTAAPAVSTPPELKGQSTTISIPVVAAPPTTATVDTNSLYPAPPSPPDMTANTLIPTNIKSFVDSFLEPPPQGK